MSIDNSSLLAVEVGLDGLVWGSAVTWFHSTSIRWTR